MNLRVTPSQSVVLTNIPGSLPYITLLLIIVAAGYYQQVQTTRRKPSDDGEQSTQMAGMQNAMKIMPVVFGFISWNLVAGLGIYFATSNLFRVGQQALILRMGDGDGDGKTVKDDSDEPSGDSSDDSDDEAPKSSPSEHASKKRNRKRRK